MYEKMVRELLKQNWEVTIYYLWIPSVQFSIQRVKERVRQGGHNIPEDALKRRYKRSLINLMKIYVNLPCYVFCMDNTQEEPKLVFQSKNGKIKIINQLVMQKITNEIKN